MTALTTAFVILHLIGAAAILGGAVRQWFGSRAVSALVLWAARIQLLTGLVLTGLAYSSSEPPNHWKIAVKLLVALAVVGLAESNRKKTAAPRAILLILALTTVNVIVAFAWR